MATIDGIGTEGPRPTSTVRPLSDGTVWPGITEWTPENAGAAPPAASLPSAALEGLLALQEAVARPSPDALERDRRARKHGQQLLSALAALQRHVLEKGNVGSVLQQLRNLTEPLAEQAADPSLAEAVAAIRLRVRVELARRGI